MLLVSLKFVCLAQGGKSGSRWFESRSNDARLIYGPNQPPNVRSHFRSTGTHLETNVAGFPLRQRCLTHPSHCPALPTSVVNNRPDAPPNQTLPTHQRILLTHRRAFQPVLPRSVPCACPPSSDQNSNAVALVKYLVGLPMMPQPKFIGILLICFLSRPFSFPLLLA